MDVEGFGTFNMGYKMQYVLIAIAAASVIAMAFFVISFFEKKRLTCPIYRVNDPRIPAAFSGKRIVFLSDLHSCVFGDRNKELYNAIDRACPDLVLIGGDMMVVKSWSKMDFAVTKDLLSYLSGRYPVYYAPGNHEQRMKEAPKEYPEWFDTFQKMLKEYHVPYLENQTLRLTLDADGKIRTDERSAEVSEDKKGILLSGLALDMRYYKKLLMHKKERFGSDDLRTLLPQVNDEKHFHIVLAHNPLYVPTYAESRAALFLSGHMHGGCVRLPFIGATISPQLEIFPRYAKGYKRVKDAHVVVSAGLGTHSINLRVNNPPEMVIIELENTVRETQ